MAHRDSVMGKSLLVSGSLLLIPVFAQAQYLDPGSGSYIFQALIAGGTLAVFAIARFKSVLWSSIKRVLRKGA